MTRQRVQYIEIDIPWCGNVFGELPCTASGPVPCYNTKSTCADRDNFTLSTITLRFAVDVGDYLPRAISCIPNIERHEDISFTAGQISLGQNLGTRSSLKVTFRDHPHSDAGEGYDPYWRERGYDPFKQGSHWGKFRARHLYLQGRAIRWIQGFADQALADMDTRHFFIESFDGPSLQGTYSITAKDVLKFLDDDRALAPRPNNGELATETLGSSDTSATLRPAGVGNAEYGASGFLAIGGAEIVEFTRSGDALTLVRGRLGTDQVAHEKGDRVQTVLRFFQQRASDIIYALMVDYAGVDPAYINLDDWHEEDDAYIGRLYTGDIAEPTSVRRLVNELIEQVGLAIWWDDVRQQIRFQVLRPILTDAGRITPANVDENSLTIREQPTMRLSEMLINYGLRSALHPLNEFTSYREARFLRSGEAEADHGTPAFREVFSRWIARLQTNTAARVGAVQIGRFRNPPRKFSFSMFRQEGGMTIEQGGGYLLEGWPMQDADGRKVDVPVQITRLVPDPSRYLIEAEEMSFFDLDLGDIGDPDPPPPPDSPPERTITLQSGNNVNLRTVYNSIYPDFGGATSEDKLPITFVLPSGRAIGSTSSNVAAVDTGSFPTDIVDLKIIVRGRIQGKGGNGGRGSVTATAGGNGAPGGPAFRARVDIDVELVAGGEIWGGGGGGGGAATRGGFSFNTSGGGGGGGSGRTPGTGGNGPGNAQNGSPGTATTGGQGGASWTKNDWWEWEYLFPSIRGGTGGTPGAPGANGAVQPGANAPGGTGGAAGPAILGIGFVSISGSGSILGPQIN